MGKAQPKKVSMSGQTRLTFREAFGLLNAANCGLMDMEDSGIQESERQCTSAGRAIAKLMRAIEIAGGYNDDGSIIDPFEKAAP